ncbi:MAG: DUF4416 family protein [Candidatus Omnitrophica bacterium]|jgi:hypothetical protein|nr:DUF4416 family protein [Candidatus Omnitrophota bacterium]
MLKRQLPLAVKLISGFIYHKEEIYLKAKHNLETKFGSIDFESSIINFDFTDYYYPEMGKPLFRRFVSFKKLQKLSSFPNIKLFCMKIEKKYSLHQKRKINIDPGYINESKLVLTTTKDFSHRIHIGKDIYAEVTLYYKEKKYLDFPTTFPDYRTPEYKNIFYTIRNIYRQNIKDGRR